MQDFALPCKCRRRCFSYRVFATIQLFLPDTLGQSNHVRLIQLRSNYELDACLIIDPGQFLHARRVLGDKQRSPELADHHLSNRISVGHKYCRPAPRHDLIGEADQFTAFVTIDHISEHTTEPSLSFVSMRTVPIDTSRRLRRILLMERNSVILPSPIA